MISTACLSTDAPLASLTKTALLCLRDGASSRRRTGKPRHLESCDARMTRSANIVPSEDPKPREQRPTRCSCVGRCSLPYLGALNTLRLVLATMSRRRLSTGKLRSELVTSACLPITCQTTWMLGTLQPPVSLLIPPLISIGTLTPSLSRCGHKAVGP